jgi:hypothetical protein
MTLHEIIQKARASDIPTGGLGAGGLIFLILVFRRGKGIVRFFFLIIALLLFGAAVWWHLQRR